MSQKYWQSTPKRVPLVLSQSLTALQSYQFQVTPQFPFRGEHVIVDPGIAANLTVQPPTVGPNVQVAGGSNTANLNGAMFPPTQTKCLEWGMDIANEGNQLTLNVASLLTSTTMTANVLIMGTVAEEMTPAQKTATMQRQAAGISPAGNYHAGISPAGNYHR
jgi:hypothetical protein